MEKKRKKGERENLRCFHFVQAISLLCTLWTTEPFRVGPMQAIPFLLIYFLHGT